MRAVGRRDRDRARAFGAPHHVEHDAADDGRTTDGKADACARLRRRAMLVGIGGELRVPHLAALIAVVGVAGGADRVTRADASSADVRSSTVATSASAGRAFGSFASIA